MPTCRYCDQLFGDHCPECSCCNYSDGECLNCEIQEQLKEDQYGINTR